MEIVFTYTLFSVGQKCSFVYVLSLYIPRYLKITSEPGAQSVIFGQRRQTTTQGQAYHIQNGAVVVVASNCEVAGLLVKGEELKVKLATDLKYALPHTTPT